MKDISTEARRLFLDWIRSQEGYEYCLRTVDAVFRDFFRFSSMAAVCPYPIRTARSPEEQQDIRQEICHDFITFLLETFIDDPAEQTGLIQNILTNRTHLVLQNAWHRYINLWQEKARNKKHNPWGYLYRRAREIISQDRRFTTHRPRNTWLAYTRAPEPPAPEIVWTGSAELYSNWPLPPMPGSAPPEQEIFKARFITECALDFYARVSAYLQEDCWIPVRELTTFLVSHYPWLEAARETAIPEDHAAPLETMEDRLDRLTSLDSISVLALQAASCLSPDEFLVFCLKLTSRKTTFREMAELLNFSDHNRAYRLYNRAMTKIKKFCEDWPGPRRAELPEEVGRAFLDAMREECKKNRYCP